MNLKVPPGLLPRRKDISKESIKVYKNMFIMPLNSSEDIQKETTHLSLFLPSTEPSFYLIEVNDQFLLTPVTPGFFPCSSELYLKVLLPVKGSVKKLFKCPFTKRQKSLYNGCLL